MLTRSSLKVVSVPRPPTLSTKQTPPAGRIFLPPSLQGMFFLVMGKLEHNGTFTGSESQSHFFLLSKGQHSAVRSKFLQQSDKVECLNIWSHGDARATLKEYPKEEQLKLVSLPSTSQSPFPPLSPARILIAVGISELVPAIYLTSVLKRHIASCHSVLSPDEPKNTYLGFKSSFRELLLKILNYFFPGFVAFQHPSKFFAFLRSQNEWFGKLSPISHRQVWGGTCFPLPCPLPYFKSPLVFMFVENHRAPFPYP